MIDFACRRFELDDVINCGLGLSKADFKIMNYMSKDSTEWYTTEDLAKILRLNLSTVQRTVKRLYEKSIIRRRQKNLDNGGYIYIYQARSKKEIGGLVNDVVQSWARKVNEEFEKR